MPVPALPAATVILLRDAATSPEVLLLERHAQSDFLPDMYVFPGGRVEKQDHELADRISDLDAASACDALGPGVDRDLALDFFVAAIRETFEECGVLLARPRGERDLVDAGRAAALARHRLEVQEGTTGFRELVLAEDLDLAADLLSVHAHWITPEFAQRRFDTLFFAALAPAGHAAAHDGVEATAHVWIRAEDALAQMREGARQIIFPTACNLETLTGFASAAEAFEASRLRPVVPVLPVMREEHGKKRLVIPPEAGYGATEELLARSSIPKRLT
jgi:8-oxo-dGTP pyrophosphatase MutT (NUDIX family)